ncbi:MAG TPA: protein tyrosine phosphatase [Acidobacteria bacterium]|nr:protein tyrosine phosphatase [Acidobacteriota bacterium]
MIDLHCHVLPGVDDGAPALAEALAMCRAAAGDGCEVMVATPHQRREPWWNDDVEHLRGRAAELQAAVQEEMGDGFRVLLGGEIHADREVLSEVERLPGGTLLPLAGSRYLLLELDSWGNPDDAVHLVHETKVAGWRPILAHPELIPWLNRGLLTHLVSLGALLQVTGMSLTGDFGRRPQMEAWQMIEAGLVHFVASDAHDLQRRPPGLRRAHTVLSTRWGSELARRLTIDNPRAVIADRPLPADLRPGLGEDPV